MSNQENRELDRSALTLSGLQNEGNTLPAWVVDPQGRGGEGRADRITRDGIIVQVSGFTVRRNVLSQQGILPLNWGDGTKNFDLVPPVQYIFNRTPLMAG